MRYDKTGEGPVLVLLPALGCDGRMWGGVIDAFTVPFTILVPRIWEERTLTGAARGILDALDEVGAHRVFFAGLSMGGYAVFECMKRLPERVRAAALCDTTAFPDTEDRRLSRDQTISVVEGGHYEEVLDVFVRTIIWPEGQNAKTARDGMLAMARDMGPEAFARSMAMIRDRGSYLPVLQTTPIPLLFVAGEHDALSPPAMAAEMARQAPAGEALTIPASGHMTALENPKVLAQGLEDFFRRFLTPA